MMNINILNDLIEGVSKQIPLVNSFYTDSPYECWNVKDVRYGSVSFVVTKANTNENTTTYDAVIYYADRLMESGLNEDSIRSDSAVVIQTIVSILNQSDELINVSYPVGITFFEQDFADSLCGGYANISIEVEGMGECFDSTIDIPEIVGTSAYYTKDEIKELYPSRDQLSTVAFSGRFDDLIGIPITASQKEFENFARAQNQININLATELGNKVSNQYFKDEVSQLKTQLGDKVSQQSFNQYSTNVTKKINTIQSSVDGKVEKSVFESKMTEINNELDNRCTKGEFNVLSERVDELSDKQQDNTEIEDFMNGVNSVVTNLSVEVGKKLDKDYFESYKTTISNELKDKVSRQSFDNTISNIYTKTQTNDLINNKLDGLLGNYVTSDEFTEIVEKQIDERLDGVVEDVTEGVRNQLDEMISEELNEQIGQFVTMDEVEEVVDEKYNDFIGTEEFKTTIDELVIERVDAADLITKSELNSKNYVSKYYVDGVIDVMNDRFDKIEEIDLNDYPTKSEVDNKLKDYLTESQTRNEFCTKSEVSNTYLTKTTASNSFYYKSEIDAKFNNIDLSGYPKKTDVYTKTEIDSKLDELVVGGEIDLSNYPTKSEVESTYSKKTDVYTKTEIDSKLDELVVGGEIDLSSYLSKSEAQSTYPTKVEVQNTYSTKSDYTTLNGRITGLQNQIGNIDTILNKVLNEI